MGIKTDRTIQATASLIAAVLVASVAGERLPVRVITTADGLPRDQLNCVESDSRGFMWFCTGDGLVRFDSHASATFGRDAGLNPPGVRSFLKARDGRYWTGSDAGLFEFRPAESVASQRFRLIRRDDGQRTGGLNALASSRDGSIWCGSGHGLLRLTDRANGVHLEEVDIGLPHDVDNDRIIKTLTEDPDGTLWIGAGSGLYARRADGRTIRITSRDGLPDNQIWTVAVGTTGLVWAGGREGLTLIDTEALFRGGGSIVRRVYKVRDGLPGANIRALLVDGNTLWVGTSVGVAETSLAASGDLIVGQTLTGFYAWDIARDARGDVWVATESGAQRLSRRGFTTYIEADGLAAARISSVFENRSGDVCVTTLVARVELACFDGRRFKRVPIAAVQSIRDSGWGWAQLILQDRSGRWWVPTGEGLLQFPAGPASSLARAAPSAIYDMRAGLGANSIFRLFEDASGGIWAATWSEAATGLVRIDARTGIVRPFGPRDGVPEPLPTAHAFAEDHAGDIWIGLEEGRLLRYRDGRFTEIATDASRDPANPRPTFDHVRSLVVDRKGRLWMASTISGLGRIDEPQLPSPHVRWYGRGQGLSSDQAWTVLEDQSGHILVATARGIDRFDPDAERVMHYSSDDGVPRGEIWGGLRDRQGRIWFATTNGVARLSPGAGRTLAPPVTLVTGIRVAGSPVPVQGDGTVRVDAVTLQPGDRRLEIDFVSPGAREADGLRYQHQLEGVDRDWTLTDARTVALAGAGPGRYRFLVRATLADGTVGEPARVVFTVLAPFWRRWWFISLVVAAGSMTVFAVHRARVARLLEIERVRHRIAADLHDGVGANLTQIAILSEVVRRQAEPLLPEAAPTLASIADNARDAIDDMSDAVWSIDPRLDNLQQVIVRTRALASDLFDDAGIDWSLHAPDDATHVLFSTEQRRHVYLIVKECLTNVRRHARARHVSLDIGVKGGHLAIVIADDGIGIGASGRERASGGRGVANLRMRANALGGRVTIAPGSGGGTRIDLQIPLRVPA